MDALEKLKEDIFQKYKKNCKKREDNTQKILKLSWVDDLLFPGKFKKLLKESEIIHQEFLLLWDLMITHEIIKVKIETSNLSFSSPRWE